MRFQKKLIQTKFFQFSTLKLIDRSFQTSKLISQENFKSSNSNVNPLSQKLKERILNYGPIPVSEYMRQCLYDEENGYYTTKEKIFGTKGDFVTAPECSFLFGEMISVFLYKIAESWRFPEKIDLVEIGGGNGYLISDIISSLYDFKLLKNFNITMVEKSPKLQKIQREIIINTLMNKQIYMQYIYDDIAKIEILQSTNNDFPLTIQWYSDINQLLENNRKKLLGGIKNKIENIQQKLENYSGNNDQESLKIFLESKEFQDNIEKSKLNPLIIVNNELFDAYPIDVFVYKKNVGWCEKLVNLKNNQTKSQEKKSSGIILNGNDSDVAVSPIILSESNQENNNIDIITKAKKDKEINEVIEFEYSLSSPNTEKIKKILKPDQTFNLVELHDNDSYEFSVDAIEDLRKICELLNSRYFSASLIIDYGEEHAFSDSLRAIKNQKQYKGNDVLKYPGQADLSAYVNFKALKRTVEDFPFLKSRGVIAQGDFLFLMGIEARVEAIHNQLNENDKKKFLDQINRLLSPEFMGDSFKTLYITKKELDLVYPFTDETLKEIQRINSED